MTKTQATTFMFACAVLVLNACQIASGLSDLHVATSETSPNGAADVFTPRNVPLEPISAGMSGESAPLSPTQGAPSGPTPQAGSDATEQEAPKANQPNTMDAGMSRGGASDAGAPSDNAAVPTNAHDAQAPGSATVTDQKQPAAAGTQSMPPFAGTMASEPARAGAESMMPVDPMCTPSFPGATCDTAPQCGCNQGENCAYLSLDFPACVRAGSTALNQGCSIVTDCQPGLQCIAGACLQLCDPSQHDCVDGAACNQNFSAGRAIPGHFTCSSQCNLVDPQHPTGTLSACGAGLTCILFGQGSDCAHSIFATGRHGEPCDSSLDCAPGYNCMENGTCARWCETSSDCADGFRCEDINVSIDNTRFGLCRPNCVDTREVGCEVKPQCGCEGGMACDFLRQDDNRYSHICRQLGRGVPYSRCEDDEECTSGTSCVGSRCAPFCERDSECGDSYAQCVQVTNGSVSNSPPIPGFQVCRRPCDPAELTRPHGAYQSCPPGQGCATATDGISYCRSAKDQAGSGAACNYSTDCAVGYECAPNYGCSSQCQTNADCASGYTCAAFSTRMFADTQEWGVCIPVQQSGSTP